jgi:hypothetical protein
LDHQEFQQAVISGLDRPDFPAELRPLVGPRGLRTALIDRDTGRDFILTMYPNLLTRPPAIQDIAVRYRPSYQKGSRPGQVHRADAFTLWPGLDVYPELAEDFGRYLGVSAYTIGDESLAESLIVADEHGRVFVLDQAGEWFLGADIDDALVTLFHGREQRRLRDDGTW